MNSAILNQIRGKRISRFSLLKYGHLNYDSSVILHLESGLAIEIKSKEFKFGPYEADTLDVSEFRSETTASNRRGAVDAIEANWVVDEIETIEREDWLQPPSEAIETVGNNPTTHAWGPIGSAPKDAITATTVISSIVLASKSRDHQAMISLVDYPGLVSFTSSAQEIESVRTAYNAKSRREGRDS